MKARNAKSQSDAIAMPVSKLLMTTSNCTTMCNGEEGKAGMGTISTAVPGMAGRH